MHNNETLRKMFVWLRVRCRGFGEIQRSGNSQQTRFDLIYQECLNSILENPQFYAEIMAFDRLDNLERDEEREAQNRVSDALEKRGLVWTPNMPDHDSKTYWAEFWKESTRQDNQRLEINMGAERTMDEPDLGLD